MRGATVRLSIDAAEALGAAVIAGMGASSEVAEEVAAHLVEADLMGHASHGIVRLPQYAGWAAERRFDPSGTASRRAGEPPVIDGGGGFGVPAMRVMAETGAALAAERGIAAVAVVNTGHTGRIGAFAEMAARRGCLAILLGGGSREAWRQVVPHGGARALLPTNPYALAVPGGERGPVVLDFATSAGAGGKVYAAAYAGRPVPEGLIVDAAGQPSTDPADYLAGGALLPMAGPKGTGLALIAELVGGAMLGPAAHGMNWLGLFVDLAGWPGAAGYAAAAEACLAELRACPPAAGHGRVEVPGERERERRDAALGLEIPERSWAAIAEAAAGVGVAVPEPERITP